MDVLIVYGTYSGGTFEVAKEVESLLKEKGHKTTLQNIIGTSSTGAYEFRGDDLLEQMKSQDLVILGSCTWFEDGAEGQMHSGFRSFEKKIANKSFNDMKFAIYGLGDSNYIHFCGAVDHLEKLVTGRQGNLVNPSLRIDRYYTNTKEVSENLKIWVEKLLKSV